MPEIEVEMARWLRTSPKLHDSVYCDGSCLQNRPLSSYPKAKQRSLAALLAAALLMSSAGCFPTFRDNYPEDYLPQYTPVERVKVNRSKSSKRLDLVVRDARPSTTLVRSISPGPLGDPWTTNFVTPKEVVEGIVRAGVSQALTDRAFDIEDVDSPKLVIEIQELWYSVNFTDKVIEDAGFEIKQAEAMTCLAASLYAGNRKVFSATLSEKAEASDPRTMLGVMRCISRCMSKAIDRLANHTGFANALEQLDRKTQRADATRECERLAEACAEEEGRASLAVVDFDVGADISGDVGCALADLCRGLVYESNCFVLLNRENMISILGEQDFANTIVCEQTQCVVKYGKMLSVQKMLTGRVNQLGRTYVIRLTLTDVETACVESTATGSIRGSIDEFEVELPGIVCGLMRDSLK